ncbi:transglycosylase domain-containing protein [Rathayibacter toxicus]|nr:transglycosylase domain-containing protein [Rathayibacter toxicus]PPH62381.1 PASTA domain-containing protein [Rathayibacter toxicus]PPH81213.1 PASTA domain-containing protein [Rathayibacter toxicus]PPI64967.1 PASTA domain-containing protein [Rathayibacter toxicus]QWL25460.1 PASTA domain-containing protein [Rathayibacter toxicus]QWL29634.1 PASTA domain-containing protein [Rathayibacter toxicus]
MGSERPTVGGVITAIMGFLAMSVVAGVLVTLTITPAVALANMATNESIGAFDSLPEYLEVDKLSEKSNIYATRVGSSPQLLASFYTENRVEVPFDHISQYAKDAAVAGEDPRFYNHKGIDLPGTLRAITQTYILGKDAQGGSSITQQYVKNVLVEKAVSKINDESRRTAAIDEATRPSPERKIREMKLAIGIEKRYTKDQILQGYLNIAFFGGSTYGLETAAGYYYGTTAAKLSIAQAASLLAIVNNPDALRIDRPNNPDNGAGNGYAHNKERRDYIIGKMLAEGKISQKDHDDAVATPVQPHITEQSTGCTTAGNAGFFCDYVTTVLKNNTIFGADEDTRWSNFRRGGLNVYTTLDVGLQSTAQATLDAQVPRSMSHFDVGAVVVSVEPGTGRILSMAQNKTYSQDPDVQASDPTATGINYNTDFDHGGSSGFQPGSTYKIFTLLEWLKQGHSLNESVDATYHANWGAFKDSCDANGTWSDSSWSPRNDEGGNGGIWTAAYNTKNSENTGFVAMAKKLDLCAIKGTAESFGVHRADGDPLGENGSAVLGTNEIAPLSMATAFAGIAAGGNVCDPIAIDKIVDASGTEHQVPGASCRQAVNRNVAATAIVGMQATFAGGTTTESDTHDGVPLIGKTGTTDGALATWMSGASSKVATVVGVVNVSGSVNQRAISFPSGPVATARHRIWKPYMQAANARYGGGAFPSADGSLQDVAQVRVPAVAGLSLADATSQLEAAGFIVASGATEPSDALPGTVTRIDPSGSALRGTKITVVTSSGPQPEQRAPVAPSPATAPPAR